MADPARPCSLNKRQQLEIALALLRFARLQENDDDFAHWNAVLEANGEFDADLRAQASYQRCLRSRDLLDLAALAIELEKVAGQDPVWLLRRAALRCELGQFTEANALIAEAYSKLLERRRKDYNSLWVRSRLAWAEWLHSAARHDWSIPPPSPWASEFRESLCDPQIELERISDEAAQSLRRQQEDDIAAIPLFEAGHYKEPPKHASLRDGVTSTPLGALNNIIETAGLPVQLNYFDMLGQAKSDAAVLEFEPSFGWYSWLLRTRHDPFDRVFDRYFGRVAITQLPESVALNLAERVAAAVAYWRESLKVPAHRYASDRMFAVGRLRLFIEALARLTPRLDSDRARSCFELALGIARDAPVHPWLIDHIGNLARYSAQATAPTARSGLVLIALEWPLSGESGWRDGPWPWPNPIDSLFDAQCVRPESDTTWNHRVQQLLGAIRTGGVDRKEASLRLYYLARKGAFANSDAIRPGIERTCSFGAAGRSLR